MDYKGVCLAIVFFIAFLSCSQCFLSFSQLFSYIFCQFLLFSQFFLSCSQFFHSFTQFLETTRRRRDEGAGMLCVFSACLRSWHARFQASNPLDTHGTGASTANKVQARKLPVLHLSLLWSKGGIYAYKKHRWPSFLFLRTDSHIGRTKSQHFSVGQRSKRT